MVMIQQCDNLPIEFGQNALNDATNVLITTQHSCQSIEISRLLIDVWDGYGLNWHVKEVLMVFFVNLGVKQCNSEP